MQAIFPLLLFLTAMVAGCSPEHRPQQEADAALSNELPRIGEQYAAAKQRLLAAGWIAVPAKCSQQLICFGDDRPELASRIDNGKACALFQKPRFDLYICARPESDSSIIVTSAEIGANNSFKPKPPA